MALQRSLFAGVAGCVLAGCAATAPPPDGVSFRSEHWYLAAEGGFAVSPLRAFEVVTDGPTLSASFTNEFYESLIVSMPGTPLVSPELALYRIDESDDEARARLRELPEHLRHGQALDPEDLAAISQDVEHRYLLTGWIAERVDEGILDVQYDDYTTVNHSLDVRRFTFEQVKGRAEAIVVDLWENEILWRGAADYETARLYGEDGGIRKELDRTRAAAASRLAAFLGEP